MSGALSIGGVLRHPIASAEARESSALLVGAIAFILGTIPALLIFWGRDVAISGRGSVGDLVAIGAAITGGLAFLVGCLLRRRRTRSAHAVADTEAVPRLHWFDVAALTLAHAIIALLGWVALASVFSASFVGATLYSTAAAILAGVALALTAYGAFLSAAGLTPMLLSVVLAVFISVGVLASMLSATDPLWWQKNLSTLGISDDISALAFNLTLIIAGVMVTTIAHYATASLPQNTDAERRGRRLVQLALVLIGVLLACVGLFPLDQNATAHNLSASGMAVIYVTTVIALRVLIPQMPRVFLILGYVYVAVIAVLAGFFISGYYTLTAVELVAFVLIFSWVIVFLRSTAVMAR